MIFAALVPKRYPDFLWRYKTIRADIRKPYYARAKAFVAFALLADIVSYNGMKIVENLYMSGIICMPKKLENWRLVVRRYE